MILTLLSGIERNRAAKTEEAERDISVAFADLSQLMIKAKEMVSATASFFSMFPFFLLL